MSKRPLPLLALAACIVVGCSSPTSPTSTSTPTAPPTSTPRPSSTEVPTTAAPEPAPEAVTIAVAGDIHFEGVLRERLDDPVTALAPVTAALAAADVAVVNLETAIGEGGRPQPGERFSFQAPASALAALAAGGVDVATMANNHALDYGRESLPSTFAAVDAASSSVPPLAVVGLGRDVQAAFRPARSDVGGTVIATIGASVADLDPTADPSGQGAATSTSPGTADAVDPARLLRAVERADRTADVVVVYMHWGVQGERCPSRGQRSLADRLVGAGADVVVGSHAHRLQGDGRLGDGYVAYGLGNYAWYTPSAGSAADTGVLTLTVRPDASRAGRATVTRAVWEPARIGADGLPRAVSGAAERAFAVRREVLRECAGLVAPSVRAPG